ncbi:hypothetical protein VTL71DRAFT_7456 [Oculimacula yallundae]|uniref:Uncharacterized protein n=1 Tax=Oculimacula yallundae TaxID=86028 RepID=A0ABR4BU66_9HELO
MADSVALDLCGGILECLSNIESSDSTKPFAMFDTLQNPINPGLIFTGGPHLGSIGLPLSNGDAEIIRSSGTALLPLLKASDLDTTTPPRIWEVPANTVAVGLGVDSTGTAVSAQLSKLNLYDDGAMLDPSLDSPQTAALPGMFGTLVICLPSWHQGGDVLVTSPCDPEIKAFGTSATSAFDSSYLAWFHDVTYTMKPVTAGRRLTLTYSLIHENLGPDVLAANSNKTTGKLDMLFSYWKNNAEDEITLLACLFTDNYSQDKILSSTTLNSKDQQIIAYLREACSKYGFCLYLADMKRSLITTTGMTHLSWISPRQK